MHNETEHKNQSAGSALVTDDSTVLQSNLFSDAPTIITESPDPFEKPFPPLIRTNPLTEQSSLAACAIPSQQESMLRGKSNYTVPCFLSDVKMFSRCVGPAAPVGRITKRPLTDW